MNASEYLKSILISLCLFLDLGHFGKKKKNVTHVTSTLSYKTKVFPALHATTLCKYPMFV